MGLVEKKKNEAASVVDMSVLETKLGYQIRMADRIINRDFQSFVGMTPVQFSVFALVASNEGLSQVAIGESLAMDRASTMAIVDKLQAADLIERRKATHDRRMQALFLTEKGKEQFAVVDARVLEHEKRHVALFSGEELEQLKALVSLMRP
ncbi:MarR family winged helix-turn-helix transcriptional regulator [Aurantivibrio plasticivorans]